MGIDTGVGHIHIQRGDLTRFVDQHRLAWELTLGVLSLVYLALSFVNDGSSGNDYGPAVFVFAGLFTLEFALRCWDSPKRWDYARHHWLDIVSCIPLVGGLRSLRLLRLVRALVPLKLLDWLPDTRLMPRDSLWFLMPSLLLLWIGSAYSIWLLEHDVNPHLRSFTDALYWSFITVTSLGYGSYQPVTTEGHVLAGALIFLGVGFVSAASARLTAGWLHEQGARGDVTQARWQEQSAEDLRELHEEMIDEMRRLRAEMTELRSLLRANEQTVSSPS